ncbi:MAG: rhomboid family intramembrane serine protease [Bacteroidota bacterium]
MFRISEVVKHLLIINVLVFIADQIIHLDFFALHYPTSPKFQPFQVVTHFFMHGNLRHLIFNMFALVMFGRMLEDMWGPKKFLLFYLFCALGGAFLHTCAHFYEIQALQSAVSAYQANPTHGNYFNFFNSYEDLKGILTSYGQEQYREIALNLKENVPQAKEASIAFINSLANGYYEGIANIPMVGASGAIFGLLLAFGLLFPETEFFPIPLKAKYFVPLLMIYELAMGINPSGGDNVAHFAHLGGALFGILILFYWKKTQFDNNRWN